MDGGEGPIYSKRSGVAPRSVWGCRAASSSLLFFVRARRLCLEKWASPDLGSEGQRDVVLMAKIRVIWRKGCEMVVVGVVWLCVYVAALVLQGKTMCQRETGCRSISRCEAETVCQITSGKDKGRTVKKKGVNGKGKVDRRIFVNGARVPFWDGADHHTCTWMARGERRGRRGRRWYKQYICVCVRARVQYHLHMEIMMGGDGWRRRRW
jgi:hypothetical protein